MTLQSPTATLIPLFCSSELTGCGYPGLLDRKNCLDMCPRWESNPRLPACKASTLSTRPGSPLNKALCVCIPVLVTTFPEWLSGTEPLPHTPGAVRLSSFVFVVFGMHMHSFAGLIRWTPPPTFSDTAITDRH